MHSIPSSRLARKATKSDQPAPEIAQGLATEFRLKPEEHRNCIRQHIVKQFPSRNLSHEQRVYNYRLSRARRVVENAFGIMSTRFRVFHKDVPLSPEKVQTIVMATCSLHNFLMRNATSAAQYLPDTANDLQPLPRQSGHRL